MANGQRSQRDVRQDKPHPQHARTASPQPAQPLEAMRPHQMNSNRSRSQKRSIPKRRTVQLNLWVHPLVKAEIQRIAEQQGLSVSKVGATFLEKAIQHNLYSQHTTLLDTVIDKAIGKHMRSYSNRLAILLVRSLYASEQTRSIVTNILSRQDGMTQPDLATIITASDNKARGNITRITPQLKTLIEAVEQELVEEVKKHA